MHNKINSCSVDTRGEQFASDGRYRIGSRAVAKPEEGSMTRHATSTHINGKEITLFAGY